MVQIHRQRKKKQLKIKIMLETVDSVLPTSTPLLATDKKKDLTTTLVSVGASALVLFVTVWVVGKAWQRSQKA